MVRIAVLQPEIPHYRTEYFHLLKEKYKYLDIYVYNSRDKSLTNGLNIDYENCFYIKNLKIDRFLFYRIRTICNEKYDILLLMLHFGHISTWLLLLTKFIHKKKIILWGHGISIKRYLKEEKRPDWKIKLMLSLADGALFYTQKEFEIWKTIFPDKEMTSLNNSISNVDKIINYKSHMSKNELKKKYDIKQKTILIFCARFENGNRRIDLLLECIKKLDSKKFGFIIIGEGSEKPDFSSFPNVYDFGAVYEQQKKQELFFIADIYFQPGGLGLSVVEAMAYGKPVFTFIRSEKTRQCVEYYYVKHGENGLIFKDMDECITSINQMTNEDLAIMGSNGKEYIKKSITPKVMADNTIKIIEKL